MPSRQHQVQLASAKGGQSVRCSCAEPSPFGSRRVKKFAPMGVTKTWAETVELFNDPENHLGKFTDKDKLSGPR